MSKCMVQCEMLEELRVRLQELRKRLRDLTVDQTKM